MKSMTKKVVALSATFAMAASFAVSAATITNPAATVKSADDIEVTYTMNDGADDAQATILVYEGTAPFSDGTGANVGYINQDAATGSFKFAMRDSLKPATGTKTFNVLIGGTDVASAATTTFTLGEAGGDKTTYSISGTLGVVANYTDSELATAYAPYIEITDADYNPVGDNVAIDVSSLDDDAEGSVPFKVEGLEIGKTYILAFHRAGACPRQVILGSKIEDDVTQNIELWGCDIDDDYDITGTDINGVIALYNAGDDGYDYAGDADLDGSITGTDINAVITNFGRIGDYIIELGK